MNLRLISLATVLVFVLSLCLIFLPREGKEPVENFELVSHNSVSLKKEFFDKFFNNVQSHSGLSSREVVALIVNHHLLAGHLIAEGVSVVATQEPVRVVFVSPNHFARGYGVITSTKAIWSTPYGDLKPDLESIQYLEMLNVIELDDHPFAYEHGIFNITGFIKKALPNATIIPIILRDQTTNTQIDILASELAELPGRTLLVGSFDFSHYVSSRVAEKNDLKTLAAIRIFDYEGVRQASVDSRPGLRLVLKFAELVSARTFHLLQSTNAAKLVGDETIPETTSYITGYFTQ